YWWRPCQLVHIAVEDATGLKTKSPIRSLGLEIGYLNSYELSDSHVDLAICITAPVEVLPATRAYIRGEGFLGDKFVELKPVRYLGGEKSTSPSGAPGGRASLPKQILLESMRALDRVLESAWAEDPPPPTPDAEASPSPVVGPKP